MKLNKLIEDIETLIGSDPILVNPSSAEMGRLWRDMLNSTDDKAACSLRVLANSRTKKVYVFNGTKYLHYEVAKHIPELRGNNYGTENQSTSMFTASGNFDKGKIVFTTSDVYVWNSYPIENINILLAIDWSWSDNYFTIPIKDFLLNIKQKRMKK